MDIATVETTKARRFLFADGDEEILTEYRLNPVMDIPRLRAILALSDAGRSEDPLRRRHQALRAMGFLKRIANPDADERLNNRGYFPHYLTRRGWHWLFERGLVAVPTIRVDAAPRSRRVLGAAGPAVERPAVLLHREGLVLPRDLRVLGSVAPRRADCYRAPSGALLFPPGPACRDGLGAPSCIVE